MRKEHSPYNIKVSMQIFEKYENAVVFFETDDFGESYMIVSGVTYMDLETGDMSKLSKLGWFICKKDNFLGFALE